jgi:hypothetical protein
MNLATHSTEGSVSAPVLYMALELSHKTWRLALSDGTKRRQVRLRIWRSSPARWRRRRSVSACLPQAGC